jgi:hypothetical protein
MKPIEFKEHNVVFAKNQPEYIPLPAYKYAGTDGEVVSCWQLSFIERMRLLLTGKVWLMMLTFHEPLTPVSLTTVKKEFIPHKEKTYKKWYCKAMNFIDFRLWHCDCHYQDPYGKVTAVGCKKHD